MERLTKRTSNGKVGYALLGPGECVDVIDLLHVWGDRLAAYEDTGLEPVEGEEKRAILQRLTDYRAAHGLGSLEVVSREPAHRTNDRISSNTLRMVLTGDIKLPIDGWRKIARALDILGDEEK